MFDGPVNVFMMIAHRHQTLSTGVTELARYYLLQVTNTLVHISIVVRSAFARTGCTARVVALATVADVLAGLVVVQVAVLRVAHQRPAVLGSLEQQGHCESLHQRRFIDKFPAAVHFRGRIIFLRAGRCSHHVAIAEATIGTGPAVIHRLAKISPISSIVIVIDKVLAGDQTVIVID